MNPTSDSTQPIKETAFYRRLLGYAFNYKVFFAIGIFGFVLYSAMEALLGLTIEFFVNALSNTPSTKLDFLPSDITSSIYFVPATVVVLAALRGVGGYLGNFYLAQVGLKVVNDLRKAVYAHIVYLPQSYFDKNNSGELVSLIVYNIQQVTQSVTEAVKIFFRDGMLVLFLMFGLFYYNWKLTLVFFAVAPILAGLIYFASRYFLRVSRRIQQAMGRVTHIATESLQGIQLVKSFRGENFEVKRFKQAADDNLLYNTKYERVKSIQTPTLHFFISIALATIMLLVILFWEGTAAEAVAYIGFAGMIAKPFRQLTTINSIIQKGIAASETIFEVLDAPQEKNTGTIELKDVKGQIEFRDLVFSYGGEEPAIKGLNLSVAPGETLALVGESGSGKTTLASLLLRFYKPDSGQILIDDQSINDIELSSLRANIALVNQNAILFNDSIKANIAYGEDLKDATDADIEAAATDAYARHFIEQLDQQFDSDVGEAGDRLSGGQRQRVTIARALLKNAPILILDEATSALDNESEQRIQAAMEKLKQGRTTIVIAHRLSTIENADKIAVLDKGQLVELGNHQSLIAKGGYYAALHSKTALDESE